MNLINKPVYSPWNDLVFHMLSCIPVEAREAGNLYDPGYASWWEGLYSEEARLQRTITIDAPIIARMYYGDQMAFKLNLFVMLYNEFDEFEAAMDTLFAEIKFDHPIKQQIVRTMNDQISPDLIEMFRIALWSEAQAGFFELHSKHIVPLYEAGIPQLESCFQVLIPKVKGLDETHFIVSHPLRRAGRLMVRRPISEIALGVPHDVLGIDAWAPAIQGCHEFILSRCIESIGKLPDHNPRVGSAGHFAHMAPEIIALSVEARLLLDTMGDKYLNWLSTVLSPNCAQLAEALPWDIHADKIPQTHGIDTVARWLASGDAIPENLMPNFFAALDGLKPDN